MKKKILLLILFGNLFFIKNVFAKYEVVSIQEQTGYGISSTLPNNWFKDTDFTPGYSSYHFNGKIPSGTKSLPLYVFPQSGLTYNFDGTSVEFNLFLSSTTQGYYETPSLNLGYNSDSIFTNGTSSTNEIRLFGLGALVQIRQGGAVLPCTFGTGTIGSGFISVKCPLSPNHRSIDRIDIVLSDSKWNLNEEKYVTYYVGIPKIFSIIKEDNGSTSIQSSIVKQTEQQHEDAQQTHSRLDSLNNSITSNSDDTSSESCGLICKLKGIFTGIIELPGKLVNLLVEALKALFVPTDQQLYEIINDSKELSENFGFVGESINFFITIFTSLLGLVNANGCVELPEFTVGATSMFDSVTFWESQLICLNDNVILSTHIETIRTITSIVLVCLFINFAAAKFFSILSKNDSGSVTEIDSNGNVSGYEWSNVNGDKRINRW